MDISGDKYDLRVGHTANPKVGYLDLTFQINSKAKETQKNNLNAANRSCCRFKLQQNVY